MKSAQSCVVAFLLFCLHLGAQNSVKAPIRLPFVDPSTPQGMEGGFWRLDGNFEPILRLKNVLLNRSVTVTPSLFFADGTELKLTPTTILPAGTQQINLRYAIANVPEDLKNHISTFGMAAISYEWSWPAVLASIQNTDEVDSLTFTSSLRADVRKVHGTLVERSLQNIYGTWWLPTRGADAFVVLENTTRTEVKLEFQLLDHLGAPLARESLEIPREGAQIVRYSDLIGGNLGVEKRGGIHIQYTGPEFGVLAYEGIVDAGVGYSASPQLIEDHLDADRAVQDITASAPGVLLGKADPTMQFPVNTYFRPYAVLHNLSTHTATVHVELTTQNGPDKSNDRALTDLTLQPGETAYYDFDSQFREKAQMPDGLGNISFSFHGQVGDIQILTGSVDQSQSYVFEVPTSVQADSASRTLCFWSTEGDNDTMISIWNYKLTSQDLVLTLHYYGGTYQIPLKLGARSSYNLDVMSLLRSRLPDPKGVPIPDNIKNGSAFLSSIHGEIAPIGVAVSSSVFNVRNATCGNICNTCNGVTEMGFVSGIYTVVVGDSVQTTVNMTTNTGGVTSNPPGGVYNAGNTAIASINTAGIADGSSVGDTPITFTMYGVPIYAGTICAANEVPCPYQNMGAGTQANVVKVTVNSANLWNNQISVALTGDPSASGTLTISLIGASTYTFQYGSSAVGPGNYTVTMNRTNIPADTYTSIQATWNVPSAAKSGALNIKWKVLGLIRHSQYNTPYESACSGSSAPAWIINVSNCTFTQIQGGLNSAFIDQTVLNGTGVSNSHGIMKYTPGTKNQCAYPTGSNDSNTFLQVSSVTGSCNRILDTTSVATNPNPVTDVTTFGCGDNLSLISSGNAQQAMKYPEDYCPACNAGFNGTNGHIDNYSTNQACTGKAVGDYGNYWTADTYASE